MKKILNNINYSVLQGELDVVNDITIDSKKTTPSSLFVCLSGAKADGHSFIEEAYKSGCRNFVIEKDIDLNRLDGSNIIRVDDTRKSLSLMAQNFYDNPALKLCTIGITGTKGKTTTAQMIKNIIEATGSKCGLIGTLGIFIGNNHYKTVNTTPESLEIQKHLKEMVDSGCKYVVMEVSSQALKVGRVHGMTFDYGIFTNLSEDHIGENEHKDYNEYRECKARLFQNCKCGLLNIDDNDYYKMIENATCEIKTFGIDKSALYRLENYAFLQENGKIGMSFVANNSSYKIYTPGKFSVYNALCASSIANELGIDNEIVANTLENFKVKGRLEPVKVSDKFTVLIDYAHEAMSLKSLLTTIKEYNPKRIVTLFGCGGNRSKIRRYEMGEIAGCYSDLTILTEDNSRFENVTNIIDDIKIGMQKTKGQYVVIENRKDAIKFAIKNALDGDIILLCGKGHEDYQEIKGVRYHMDERELIKEILLEIKESDLAEKKKIVIRK